MLVVVEHKSLPAPLYFRGYASVEEFVDRHTDWDDDFRIRIFDLILDFPIEEFKMTLKRVSPFQIDMDLIELNTILT